MQNEERYPNQFRETRIAMTVILVLFSFSALIFLLWQVHWFSIGLMFVVTTVNWMAQGEEAWHSEYSRQEYRASFRWFLFVWGFCYLCVPLIIILAILQVFYPAESAQVWATIIQNDDLFTRAVGGGIRRLGEQTPGTTAIDVLFICLLVTVIFSMSMLVLLPLITAFKLFRNKKPTFWMGPI